MKPVSVVRWLALGAAALGLGVAGAGGTPPLSVDSSPRGGVQQADPLVLSGSIRLDGAFLGELEDHTKTVESRDLGMVDFVTELHVSESGDLTGLVQSAMSPTFRVEIGEQEGQGPAVSGRMHGGQLLLESIEFEWALSGATILQDGRMIPGRTAFRRFRLSGDATEDGGYTGEYRETVSGVMPDPVTVVGHFDIAPSFSLRAPTRTPGGPSDTPRPTRTSTRTPGGPTPPPTTPESTGTATVTPIAGPGASLYLPSAKR